MLANYLKMFLTGNDEGLLHHLIMASWQIIVCMHNVRIMYSLSEMVEIYCDNF